MTRVLALAGTTIDERREALWRHFAHPSVDVGGIVWVVCGLGALVGLLLVIRHVHRRRLRRQAYNPRLLLRDALCEIGLSKADRRLVEQAARDLNLTHPVSLILSPDRFDSLIKTWERSQRSRATAHGARWQAIRKQLFS